MGVIAYLHFLYLKHSSIISLGTQPDRGKDSNLPDYMTIGRVREPPVAGPTLVHGVDKGGFKIEEDATVTQDGSNGRTEDARGKQGDHIRKSVQFNLGDTLSQTSARADLNKHGQIVVKGMTRHAWSGYIKYTALHDELKPMRTSKSDYSHG
ncbi:hypothetical protein BGZ50_006545 [Haplosporangium sp. Z 11]|nr:hypothetical protein BGZ50_006545 [Haplosporangium sp. Z 11]